MEVKFLSHDRGRLYVQRSNRFLALSFLIMGGIAILASLFVSRRLTLPLKKLVDQTRAISKGELTSRTEIAGEDELGKLAHAFNEMADDLELQESLRRKLIANVAHELRTPLAAMRGELEGMIDGVLASDDDQLRSLYEETGRLRAMLDGIDDLTQAQASSLTLVKQQVELAGFIGNIGERFRARAGEEDIRINVEVEEDVAAWADPDRLSQIVINLLENAIRATSENGSVTLRSGREETCAFIEVRDTGEGISGEELPFIFERFFRGARGGLGLGLTIAKELVDAHGGEIIVHSEVGKGTSVRVTLPSGPKG
jgi:two-component system sensor histidine kinase BaeS